MNNMNISIFKEVIFNKDLMKKIQTFKLGWNKEGNLVDMVIKHGSINAYIELVKDTKLDERQIKICISYNRHDILDIVKPLVTEEYFKCAFYHDNIEMMERFKEGATSDEYIVDVGDDLDVLRYILENNILREDQIIGKYDDGTGLYKIDINTLAHVRGDVSFMDWYCKKIDLLGLVEYKNYDTFMHFINHKRAANKYLALRRLKRLLNDIDGDNNEPEVLYKI